MESLGRYCGLAEDWRKLHVEDLHQFCCSLDITWMKSTGEAVVVMEEMERAYRVLVEKTLRKESI